MAEHTPGPWCRDGRTVFALMHAGWRKGVEQFKNRFSCGIQGDNDCNQGELEANARLIAAAPEMLEALQWIAECGTDYQSICRAKGAIAKVMEGDGNG